MVNQNKTKVIFSMSLAAQLKARGHRVLAEIPNPVNNKYISWIFEVDETFEEDFKNLQRKD